MGPGGGFNSADVVGHKEWWGFFSPVIFISSEALIRDLAY